MWSSTPTDCAITKSLCKIIFCTYRRVWCPHRTKKVWKCFHHSFPSRERLTKCQLKLILGTPLGEGDCLRWRGFKVNQLWTTPSERHNLQLKQKSSIPKQGWSIAPRFHPYCSQGLPLECLNAANGEPYFGTHSAVVADSEHRCARTKCTSLWGYSNETAFCINVF